LSTDKPLYQPGQVIHLRALALGALDRRPAVSQTLDLTIADGKGNKVFRQAVQTSAYGVASADFPLAAQVNTGPYKISAALDNGQARFYLEATVIDLAKQSEKANLALPIANSRLVIEALPEGGQLRLGVDNILYILTSYPDGSPAQASIDFTFEGKAIHAQT